METLFRTSSSSSSLALGNKSQQASFSSVANMSWTSRVGDLSLKSYSGLQPQGHWWLFSAFSKWTRHEMSSILWFFVANYADSFHFYVGFHNHNDKIQRLNYFCLLLNAFLEILQVALCSIVDLGLSWQKTENFAESCWLTLVLNFTINNANWNCIFGHFELCADLFPSKNEAIIGLKHHARTVGRLANS